VPQFRLLLADLGKSPRIQTELVAHICPDVGVLTVHYAAALAQALVAGIALALGMQHSAESSVTMLVGVNTLFVALFVLSGFLSTRKRRTSTPVVGLLVIKLFSSTIRVVKLVARCNSRRRLVSDVPCLP
jgi:hypothetical protein